MLFIITNSVTFSFQYQTSFAQVEREISIGFGGNNQAEKIYAANLNNSIPNVGEINNYNSTSKGLKIFITINNISNLLNLDKNITDNLFLKVEEQSSLFNESDYMTYKFSNSDFVDLDKNNIKSKTILFLFYPGLMNDESEFKTCLYYFKDYDREVLCKRDVNAIGNKQEKIEFTIPKIIDLDSLISNTYFIKSSINKNSGVGNNVSSISDTIKNISFNNKFVESKVINISKFNNTDLAYVSPDKYNVDLSFASSINKILVIGNNGGDFVNQYLTQVNASDMRKNLEEIRLSGNGVLHINGFVFDDQTQKIYAFGDYHYLRGNQYDIRFGLAPEYHYHSIFVIDPKISKITDFIKLWGGEEEGDETLIGNIYINSKDHRMYVTAINEGEMDKIFIIDTNTLQIKKTVSINEIIKGYYDDQTSFDKKNDIFYMCSDDTIIGIKISDFSITKNLSSIYCPQNISSKKQMGYFMGHNDLTGFIDLEKGDTTLLLKDGNVSNIFVNDENDDNKTALVVGHNTDDYPHSCFSNSNKIYGPPISYIIKINIADKSIVSISKFNNVFIDELIQSPSSGKLYALTGGILSVPYVCYENSKIYDLGYLLEKDA